MSNETNEESIASIEKKIDASDGKPTFLSSAYRVEIEDLWVSGIAVKLAQGIYIPVASISAVTKQPVVSDWDAKTLSTSKGKVPGEWMNNAWYVRLEDVPTLFELSGTVESDGVLRLRKIPQQPIRHQELMKDEKAKR